MPGSDIYRRLRAVLAAVIRGGVFGRQRPVPMRDFQAGACGISAGGPFRTVRHALFFPFFKNPFPRGELVLWAGTPKKIKTKNFPLGGGPPVLWWPALGGRKLRRA